MGAIGNRNGDVVLDIERVSKAYVKGVPVNDNVSLTIHAGEIFGLLGPNGAGKTTLVNQIIGLVRPNSGSITLAGVDVVANPQFARQACSFQAQTQVPITGLTTLQAIELVGRVRGGSKNAVRERAKELVALLDMEEWANKGADAFSGGMRRLAAFCMAAVTPGRVVILDEPTNDIDPLRRRLLWRQVRALAGMGSAVLLVTHNVLEAERTVDRLAIMKNARVIAMGTPASLKENGSENMRLELVLEPGVDAPAPPHFVRDSFLAGRRLVGRLREADIATAAQWARALKEEGKVEEFSLGPATLEDAYVRMVGGQDAADPSEEEVGNAAVAA
jgi:ABC-2 type transport system ATP-binding protein